MQTIEHASLAQRTEGSQGVWAAAWRRFRADRRARVGLRVLVGLLAAVTAFVTVSHLRTASRDEIAGLQLERMKWSVRHAYENSPFYRRRFDQHGVHPDDLRSLADLAKFPFTVKQDLRDTYPFGMFAVPRQQVVRIHASGAHEMGPGAPPVQWFAMELVEGAPLVDFFGGSEASAAARASSTLVQTLDASDTGLPSGAMP